MSSKLLKLKAGKTWWDDQVKGLHLRVFESGKRAFYLKYRLRDGKQRRPKIGQLPETSLKIARERARLILHQVAMGKDPKGNWDNSKTSPTIASLFERAWLEHWNQERFIRSRHAHEVEMNYNNHIHKQLGGQKITALTLKEIKQWHKSLGEKSFVVANRSLSILSKIFDQAITEELVDFNLCAHVARFSERKRSRYASEQEIKKIVKLLEAQREEYPREVAFIYLLMYSGARPSVIEKATWKHITKMEVADKTFGVLKIKGKTYADHGEEDLVILPATLMKTLEGIEPKTSTITGIKTPRKFWEKIREEAGCPDLWLRDWRRTFATLGFSNNVGIGLVSELLNHKSTQTTKLYAKLNLKDRALAVSLIEDKLNEIIE